MTTIAEATRVMTWSQKHNNLLHNPCCL